MIFQREIFKYKGNGIGQVISIRKKGTNGRIMDEKTFGKGRIIDNEYKGLRLE